MFDCNQTICAEWNITATPPLLTTQTKGGTLGRHFFCLKQVHRFLQEFLGLFLYKSDSRRNKGIYVKNQKNMS